MRSELWDTRGGTGALPQGGHRLCQAKGSRARDIPQLWRHWYIIPYTHKHIHIHLSLQKIIFIFDPLKSACLSLSYCKLILIIFVSTEGDGEPAAAKRKKTEAEEGEKIIAEFVSRAEQLAERQRRGEISKEEAQQQLEAMKKKVKASKNSYIQKILESVESEATDAS